MDGIIRLPLTRGYEAIIDAEDFEREHVCGYRAGFQWRGRVCDRKWMALPKQHTVYAKCSIWAQGRQHELRLHRLIMDAPADKLVDHIDGNGLNCRKKNLRFATYQGNSANCRRTTGTTRFKGVAVHRETGKFEAYIKFNGKKRHLGLFVTAEAAAAAYDAAAVSLWGEFAKTNAEMLSLESTL